MFDMHRELNQFYNDHVRLQDGEQVKLREYRDRNIDRLKTGLGKLDYPSVFRHCNQGSYAMHTINQAPDNDYDIDVAVIFPEENLPNSAYEARKRVEKGINEGGGNFSKDPEALTNAVRVYYAEGYHIDLAVYREYQDEFGCSKIEHAGSDWSARDPVEITDWFNQTVRDRSPLKDHGATVGENQMRRIVRWLKAFIKAHSGGSNGKLPGGLITSVLVSECYKPHYHRDDISLYQTMVAIQNRTEFNVEVTNPVDFNQLLTHRSVDKTRVRRLGELLNRATSKLSVVEEPECTDNQAHEAWFWVFQHDFWNVDGTFKSVDEYGKLLGTSTVYWNRTSSQLTTEKPSGKHIEVPKQRFFGDE